ncbi:MAG TPA: hypothetical protein VMD92_00615 [Acidobacteriaceae bacterium]|nr:hypothetical protein [Acidobacteriaceae bacterium]
MDGKYVVARDLIDLDLSTRQACEFAREQPSLFGRLQSAAPLRIPETGSSASRQRTPLFNVVDLKAGVLRS